jgi:hypothetical protein
LFEPFPQHLTSKFGKSAKMIHCFFCHKIKMDIKNAKFDADLNSNEKVAKNLLKKAVSEKVTEKCSFILLLLCPKVFGF